MLTLSKPESAADGSFRTRPTSDRRAAGRARRPPRKAAGVFLSGSAGEGGYHVTEVKAANFSALDCGANPEAWSEIFVQLWDVDEGGREHMPAGKFSAIIRKVTEHLRLDEEAQLTFEVSDGVAPIQLHKAAMPLFGKDAIRVELSPRAASCKPRDRWLAAQEREQASCCGSKSDTSCCGRQS